MKKQLTAAILLAGLLGTAASFVPGTAPAEERSIGLQTYSISNGVTVYFQPRYDLEATFVSLYLPFPAIFRNEGPGVARYLGALYLDTAGAGEDSLRQQLATLDATASMDFEGDHLVFRLRCLPGSLNRSLGATLKTIAGGRLREPFLGQARGVIERENRLALSRGWPEIRDRMVESLRQGNRLADVCRELSGEIPRMELLTGIRPGLLDPAKVRLVVTGSSKVGEAIPVLIENVKEWKSEPVDSALRPLPEPLPGFDFDEWQVPADPSRVVLCFRGPADSSPQMHAFCLAASMLAGGFTSLAGKQFYTDQKMIPVIPRCRFFPGEKASYFMVELQTAAPDFDDAERAFFTALRMLTLGKWHAVDLERCRHQAFVLLVESTGRLPVIHDRIRASRQAENIRSYGDWKEKLEAVKGEAVTEAARQWLTMDRCTVLELPGSKTSRGYTARSFRETMEGLIPVALKESLEKFTKLPDIPLEVPAADPLPAIKPETVENVVASGILRGPGVLLAERHRLPLIHLEVAYPGGVLTVPDGYRALGNLALLQRFFGCRDGQERLYLERLEMLGGRVEIQEEPEACRVSCVFPAYFRRTVTDHLFRILHWRETKVEDTSRCLSFARLWDGQTQPAPATRLIQETMGRLYGPGNPFARQSGRLSKATVPEIQQYYERQFYRALPRISLVGDFEGTELLAVIGEYVSGSSFSDQTPAPFPAVFNEGKLPDAAAPAGWLEALAFPGPYGGENDLLRLEVLRRLFFETDRQAPPVDRVFALPLLSRGCIQIHFPAGVGTSTTAAGLLDWFKNLAGKPINSWNLATAIKMTELSLAVELSEPDALSDWLVRNALWKGRLWDKAVRDDVFQKISKEQIRDLASRFLLSGKFAHATVPAGVACQPASGSPSR